MPSPSPSRLINLLSYVTSFVLVLWAIIIVLNLILLIMSLFGSNFAILNNSWPVLFSDELLSSLYTDNNGYFARPHDSDLGSLQQFTASLSPRDYLWPYYESYKNMALLVKLSLYMGVVYLFHRIILDIRLQRPFNQTNIQRLKHMALLLFLVVPFSMLDTLVHHSYMINHIELTDIELVSRLLTSDTHAQSMLQENQVLLSNQRNFSPLLYAVMVYLMALVFQEGLKLKQDSESIV